MALTGRAAAWLNLALHFGQHVVLRLPTRPFRSGRDVQRFLDAVLPEGYLPLQPHERELYPAFMRCVNCGLCTLQCPALRAAPASAWQDTWTFVAGPSRSLDRAPLVAAELSPCTDCGECAAACPTGVPIPQLAAVVRRLAETSDRESS